MTWQKLTDECTPMGERERSAEEFFDRFPEEYQRSRDSIRKLFELLKKRHEEKPADKEEPVDTVDPPCPEDVHQPCGLYHDWR